VQHARERRLVERSGRREEVVEYHVTMVAQPELHDNDLVLWTQLLAETLNAELLDALHAEFPDVRYAHGFLFQQLVEGPRPVGEVAENLGVTSQAISKAARELEALGYVERTSSPADARVRLLKLSDRGRAAVEASRAARAALNAELVASLGAAQVEAAAETMRAALESRNAMQAVASRRVRSAQGLLDGSR
jgi:DNA-binding MarR family transcriptional regulator